MVVGRMVRINNGSDDDDDDDDNNNKIYCKTQGQGQTERAVAL
jgi:hypothetical protein